MAEEADPLTERLASYVSAAGADEMTEVVHALAEARALVDRHLVGSATPPEAVTDRAVIECGAELFNRKGTRNGVMEIGGADLAPFRIARDPMKAAYAILAPYVVGLA